MQEKNSEGEGKNQTGVLQQVAQNTRSQYEGGTVINVQAVYDEEKLKKMAENTANVSYSVMSLWPNRPDHLMDVKALAMGFLAALDDRNEARARYRVLEKQHLNACASREAHRVNAENSQAAEKRALAERDDALYRLEKVKNELEQVSSALCLERERLEALQKNYNDLPSRTELDSILTREADNLATALDRAQKAERFKSYVHARLDQMGVPSSPAPAVHALEGCRVGDRLDWLADRLAVQFSPVERRRIGQLEISNVRMKSRLEVIRQALSGLLDTPNAEPHGKT